MEFVWQIKICKKKTKEKNKNSEYILYNKHCIIWQQKKKKQEKCKKLNIKK